MAVLTLAAAGCAPFTYLGAAYDPPVPAPDINLIDMNGSPFRLADRQGQIVLLTFGYTHCPDVCPATLGIMRQALAALQKPDAPIAAVFVTVDPLRDTPPVLRDYLGQFSAGFLGVTGDPLALAETMDAYGISAVDGGQGLPGLPINMDHTARLYLIDPAGQLRVQYLAGMTADDLTHDLAHLLESG